MTDVAPNANQLAVRPPKKFVLWVDGAGGALVLLGEEVTMGGVRQDANHSDVCLLSNLARKHLTLNRVHGSYQLQAHHPVRFQNQPFPTDPDERIVLEDKAQLIMGEGVEIRFQQISRYHRRGRYRQLSKQ